MEETKGQDVALNMLEVFVNRWRHMLANVTSLCLEKGEGKRTEGEQHLIFNGTKDIEIERKRKIREKSIRI